MKRIVMLSLGLMAMGSVQAGVVVIANPAAGGVSKDQIADVFLGKDTSYTPLDQPESAPVREAFYSKATGRNLAQVRANWSRLTFSGKATPPRELPNADSVKAAVAADPKALGYIDSSAVDGSVKVVLSLD